jgi:glycosyltransferase involved in cell wall biosynthesis
MAKLHELSVFFPFWNEEENIEPIVRDAMLVLPQISDRWEIIMVDDGSTDATLKIAERLASSDQRLRVVSHQPNRGYGSALKEGFENSRYQHVVFTDGDRQFDFKEIHKFLPLIENHDMVIGYRMRRRDHWLRYLIMQMLKMWDFIFFGFYFRDIDCGFKMFRRSALDKFLPLESEGNMITTEFLAKAIKNNLLIAEVGVQHYPRQFGSQGGLSLHVIFRAVQESWKLWRMLHRSSA